MYIEPQHRTYQVAGLADHGPERYGIMKRTSLSPFAHQHALLKKRYPTREAAEKACDTLNRRVGDL